MRRDRAGLGLLLAAAVFFLWSSRLTIEWVDEGNIVYPSWLVAQGAIPYRDFQHLYGPSLFFLHGALFALFGPDLLVSRLALVLVKLLIVGLVYRLSVIVADRRIAGLVAALLVLVMASPAWGVFNMPYAHHDALAASLLGVVVFLAARPSFAVRCAIAGLCFGVAATFKQTTGLFAYLSFGLSLIAAARPARAGAATGSWRLEASVSATYCMATVAAAIAYVKRAIPSWTVVVLLAPLLASATRLAWRAPRMAASERAKDGPLAGIAAAGLGFVLPLGCYAAFYGWLGELSALAFNAVAGWPQMIEWFVPLPVPSVRPVLIALGILLPLAAWPAPRRWFEVGTLATVVIVGWLAADVATGPGVVRYLAVRGWESDALEALFVFLVGLVWISFGRSAASAQVGIDRHGGHGDEDRVRIARSLVFYFAVTSLLALYPAADEPHVLIVLPAFAPLLADRLARVRGSLDMRWRARPLCSAVLGASLIVCTVTILATLGGALQRVWASPARVAGYPRATQLSSDGEAAPERLAIARALEASGAPDARDAFVIVNEQMSYFLAGRRSAFDGEEFVFYLVGLGLIRDEDARRLVDEQAIVARLRDRVQTVVVNDTSAQARRYRAVYPGVMRYIDQNFRPTLTVGGYRVLQRLGER